MGSLFKRTERRPVPRAAEIVEKAGKRFARWKARGKTVTVPIDTGPDGTETVLVKGGVYVARFRSHSGQIVERSTGCRDESTARQRLGGWEREVEQILAGVLDAGALDTARAAAGPLAPLIDAYQRSLVTRDLSAKYRENLLRDLRKLVADLPVKTVRDLRLSTAEPWFACAVAAGVRGRTRNRYRESLVAFANWCVGNGKLREHDLDKLPKADPKADPVRPRRAMTEGEFVKLLDVARTRPLDDARTVRRGKRKGQRVAVLAAASVEELDESDGNGC